MTFLENYNRFSKETLNGVCSGPAALLRENNENLSLLGNKFKSKESYNDLLEEIQYGFENIKKDLENLFERKGFDAKISIHDRSSDPFLWAKISDNGNLKDEGQISVENQESLYDDFSKIVRKNKSKRVKFAWTIAGLGNLDIKPLRLDRETPSYLNESKVYFL